METTTSLLDLACGPVCLFPSDSDFERQERERKINQNLVKEENGYETAVDNGTMMQLIVRENIISAGTLGVQLKSINKQSIKPLLTRC